MRVSVVMAVYNGRKFLAPMAESVLSQLRPGDELIVIDDASNDDSAGLLRAMNSPFLHIHANIRNLGVKRTFERGLRLACGEIVFLADQDDIWLPGKRSAFVAEFERHPSTLVVTSDAEIIDGEGLTVAPSLMALRGGFKSGVIATLWRNRYTGCTMAVRRRLLDLALPIPSAVPMHDIWLGIIARLRGEVTYLQTPYLQYRRHDTNESPLHSRMRWGEMARWRLGLMLSISGRWLQWMWARLRRLK